MFYTKPTNYFINLANRNYANKATPKLIRSENDTQIEKKDQSINLLEVEDLLQNIIHYKILKPDRNLNLEEVFKR